MAKSKRFHMEASIQDDFHVIGIWYENPVYPLLGLLQETFMVRWSLRQHLERGNSQSASSSFALYTAQDETMQMEYGLICNLANHETPGMGEGLFQTLSIEKRPYLLPDYKEWNYFLLLKGLAEPSRLQAIAFQLQQQENIRAAQWINLLSEPHKEILQF